MPWNFSALNLSSRHLYLAFSIALTTLSILTFLIFDDYVARFSIIGLIVLLAVLGSFYIFPSNATSNHRTIRTTFWIYCASVSGIVGAFNIFNELITSFVNKTLLYFGYSRVEYDNTIVIISITCMTAAFAFVMWALRDRSALGSIPPDPAIRQPIYLDKRRKFCEALQAHLRVLDEELRWQDQFFVALNAEVDVKNGDATRRRITDLVKAIRVNKQARIFTVIGVPGAGKSVALRKCCMDLLRNQKSAERIPIYINLKEWTPKSRWDVDNPPSDEEFSHFVKSNVRQRLPDMGRPFFEENFDRLVQVGEIFFMFDSFDEMPGILDVNEDSKIIAIVSNIILRYLSMQDNGRGVIASRYYRRPRLGRESHVQLDVRPFADAQIEKAIDQSVNHPEHLKDIIFKKRPDLGGISRNPFTLSLIMLYWEQTRSAPPNQSALFAQYIEKSIEDAHENLTSMGILPDDLKQSMEEISWAMYQNERGLEMTVSELRSELNRANIDGIIDALIATRLARKAARTQAVSFVHRRFNEYFLVARWISGAQTAPHNAVPTDSRFRDALVLYAEVAQPDAARELANFCWNETQQMRQGAQLSTDQSMRGIFALRFLTEAYRARLEAISDFRSKLGSLVKELLVDSSDIIAQKLAVESVGLMKWEDATQALLLTFSKNGNRWLQETAFGACRYLPSLNPEVEFRALEFLKSRPKISILMPDRDFWFSIRMADAFKNVYRDILAYKLGIQNNIIMLMTVILLHWHYFNSNSIIISFTSFIYAIFTYYLLASFNIISKLLLFRGSGRSFLEIISISQGESPVLEFYRSLSRTSRDVISMVIIFLNISTFTIILLSFLFKYLEYTRDFSDLLFPDSRIFDDINYTQMMIILSMIYIFGISSPISLFYHFKTDGGRSISRRISLYFHIIRKIIKYTPQVILTISVYALFMVFIQRYEIYAVPVILLMLIFISIYILFLFIRSFVKDRLTMRKATVRYSPLRLDVAEVFGSFAFEGNRIKYLDWLERESAASEFNSFLADLAANPWPNNQRPNLNGSESSIRLAKLDARWLRIEV